MANRSDRRASAKIARQAVKRAKTPTEAAILRAAAAFAVDDIVGQFGSCLFSADFDEAWVRLTDDLRDILEERYPEFRAQAYAQAGIGALRADGPDGAGVGMGTRLLLFPVSGSSESVSSFAGDAGKIARLETSLREFGVVSEDGRCLVLPLVLSIAAFAPEATSPARVHALHGYLRHRLVERMAGRALPSPDDMRDAPAALRGMQVPPAGAGMAIAALVGIELIASPLQGAMEVTEEEFEAEEMAKLAVIDSWHDSYAAEIADVSIGAPLDWPACAAALAWETIRIPMESALLRHGVPDGRPEVIHCATTDDGESVVVSAVAGSVAVGPFSAPADLAWFDADEFFGRAEASAGTFAEHDNEGDVVAPLLGAA